MSRSLAACDGALLVVDAGQGVEAQSVANCYTAIEQGLEVLPVINKIDLPTADPERVIGQIEDIIGIAAKDAVRISAKTGLGVDELLERIVERIPAPKGSVDAPLQALIIDSWFDSYAGVVSLVRVMNGVIRKDARIVVHSTQRKYTVEKVGVFTPRSAEREELKAGEVGFLIAAMREINAAPVGDTIVDAGVPNVRGAAGVQEDPAQSIRRPLPARVRGLREVPRGPPEARLERLIAHVRARGQRVARLRHALRFLGPAAHGDHSGAARARARSFVDLDGADGRL